MDVVDDDEEHHLLPGHRTGLNNNNSYGSLDPDEDQIAYEGVSDRRRRLLYQTAIVSLVGLGYMAMGLAITFPSVLASDMSLFNTTIYNTTITFTDSQMDMVGSMVQIAGFPGVWIAGVVAAVLGRKLCMMLFAMVMLFSWCFIALLKSPAGILGARVLSGMAVGGLTIAADSYLTEVPDIDVRGIMFGITSVSYVSGELMMLCLGYWFRYYTVALISATLPTIFLFILFFIPESPTLLYLKGKEESARRLLRRLRGSHANIEEELKSYRSLNHGNRDKSSWRGLLEKETLKNITIICGLFILQVFSGEMNILVNASRVFEMLGSSIDSRISAIIMMSVQLFGSLFFGVLLDKLGRKRTLIISFLVMGLSLTPMVAWSFYVRKLPDDKVPYDWIPLVCLNIYSLAALSVDQIPFIFAVEYFPTWIRSQANSICSTSETIFGFFSLHFFSSMLATFTTPGLYGFYAVVCFIAIPYTAYFIRETSGLDVG